MSGEKPTKQHPEYETEKKRLEETVDKIDVRIDKEKSLMPAGIHKSANQYLSDVLRPNAELRIEELEVRRKQPYFGKIDFTKEDGTQVSIYIGREALHADRYGEHEVSSRHSEAARIFYKSKPGRYDLKNVGLIDLLLQRNIAISLGRLHNFNDNFDERPKGKQSRQADVLGELTGRERHLIEILYSRGAARLQDIVETIQEHQDDLIRAPADQCLVINGVAGSGKTSIAYHRLDYLVHMGNLRPEKTIVFGPNKVFLNHVRELLPQLGVQGVVETTFDDWAFSAMGFATSDGTTVQKTYNLQDATLKMLSGSEDRALKNNQWSQGRVKGSLNFKKFVEAFAKYRREAITVQQEGWNYDDVSLVGITLTEQEVRALHREAIANEGPFEHQRAALLERAQAAVRTKALQVMTEAAYLSIAEAVDSAVQDDVDVSWPRFDLHADYYALLSNPALVRKLARKFLKSTDVDLITKLSPPRLNYFDVQDVSALYYLHKLMTRTPFETYDHIVVDEGQDLSPFQFQLLQMHSRADSMTVLGDIAQAIHGYRGLNNWQELTPIFSQKPKQEQMSKNFRSTREIVLFSNEVLKQVRGATAKVAQPIARAGTRPTIFKADDTNAMYVRLAEDLKALLVDKGGLENIALITKTDSDSRELEKQLALLGVQIDKVIAVSGSRKNANYGGGVVILPAPLSKGIEFQAVFIVQANNDAYNQKVPYDGRLLYVAVTRALHQLNLYYTGDLSGFLAGTDDVANFL